MKLGFIILRSDHGGGPRHLSDLIHGIKNLDHSIQIHTASPRDPPYSAEFHRNSDSFFALDHRKFSFSKMIELYFFFRRLKIDLIHSHGRGAGIYSGFLALMGFKVIHTFHGLNPGLSSREQVKSLIERLVWSRIKTFIPVSHGEAKTALLKYGIKQTHVIPNGIDSNSLEIKNFRELRAKRLKTNVSSIIHLGAISRLDPHKNNQTLIHKFKTLPAKYFLYIAGDGEEFESLQALILELKLETRVKLVGRISNPYEFLSSMDIFVSASKSEGLPYSVLEAKAVGLPCVLSNVQGHNEISGALLFDLNAIAHDHDFAAAIEKSEQTLTPQIISQDSQYELKTMVKNTLAVYKKI